MTEAQTEQRRAAGRASARARSERGDPDQERRIAEIQRQWARDARKVTDRFSRACEIVEVTHTESGGTNVLLYLPGPDEELTAEDHEAALWVTIFDLPRGR